MDSRHHKYIIQVVRQEIRKVQQFNKMSEDGDFVNSSDKSDFSQSLSPSKQLPASEQNISISSLLSKEGVEPPRQLPKRSYSLQPDLATGWKPKKVGANPFSNVFPINFSSQIVDYLIRQLYKRKSKQWEIAYLGPRKINSYLIHQNRKYQNPYPLAKKLDPHISERPQIPLNAILQQQNLKFNSNFQCGNLDAAIKISPNQYDLFMRVDSNTKGHTNWYFFTVQNGNFVGNVRFNICNFRRDKSLYERVFIFLSKGLKPYYFSKRTSECWKQGGQNIRYEKRKLRYQFLYEDEDYAMILKNYITLTFTYHFQVPNDAVEFAYFIPYSYSRLLKFLPTLKNCKMLPSLKSLSGLSIPVLEITDQQAEAHNKKVVVVTGRIHPGEANSSFICQGFLQYICSEESKAKEFRKNYLAYVVPMINPDGVVVGNYRTSLFGKDLNRTFNQSRRFAFPQTFHLLELIKDLKAKHKQRLSLFIDLHGHSVKKNVFMYGPQFNIQHPNYYLAKQLPKILSTLTPCFRFYSCIFRISSQKSTTARATLNRFLNIPFTYTMESSNGFYYDSDAKKQFELTSKKLKKIGVALSQAMLMFKEVETNRTNIGFVPPVSSYTTRKISDGEAESNDAADQKDRDEPFPSMKTNGGSSNMKIVDDSIYSKSEAITEDPFNKTEEQKQPNYQVMSDDNISEGNSDSQPADEDLSDSQLEKLLQTIQQGRQGIQSGLVTPNCNEGNFKLTKMSSRQSKQKGRYKKKHPLLPPINCLNRALAKQKTSLTNKTFIQKSSQTGSIRISSPQRQRIQRLQPLQRPQKPQRQQRLQPLQRAERQQQRPQRAQRQQQLRSKNLSISQMIEASKVQMGMGILRKQQVFLAHRIMKKKGSKIELQKVKFFGNSSSPYGNSKNEGNGRH